MNFLFPIFLGKERKLTTPFNTPDNPQKNTPSAKFKINLY